LVFCTTYTEVEIVPKPYARLLEDFCRIVDPGPGKSACHLCHLTTNLVWSSMFGGFLEPFGYTVAGNVLRLRRPGCLAEDFMISRYACLLIPIFYARCLCAHSVGELTFSLSNVYSSTYQSLATLSTCLLEHCLYSSYAGNYISGPYFMAFHDILLLAVVGEGPSWPA
jgi:hypothetical protein